MCRLLPITQVPTSRRFTQAPASKRLSQRFLYFCCFPFLFNKKCCERHYQCSLIKSVKHCIVFFSQIPALPLLWVWIPGKASRFEKENGKTLPISSSSSSSSSSPSSSSSQVWQYYHLSRDKIQNTKQPHLDVAGLAILPPAPGGAEDARGQESDVSCLP